MTPEQLESLKKLATDNNYGRGPRHTEQVKKPSFQIYEEFVRLGLLKEASEDKETLDAASFLHDIGLPKEPHNEVAFDKVVKYLAESKAKELSTLLYCILWHRGGVFIKRGAIDIRALSYTKKMAAILRVADALDRTLRQLVTNVTARLAGHHVIFTVSSEYLIVTELNRAKEKADLMRVLLVCGGNTCRSPMAKVILEQKLKAIEQLDRFVVDSAAYDGPTYSGASINARKLSRSCLGKTFWLRMRPRS